MEKSQIYLAKSSSSFLVGISNIWNPLTSSHSGPKTPKTFPKKNLYLKLHLGLTQVTITILLLLTLSVLIEKIFLTMSLWIDIEKNIYCTIKSVYERAV